MRAQLLALPAGDLQFGRPVCDWCIGIKDI